MSGNRYLEDAKGYASAFHANTSSRQIEAAFEVLRYAVVNTNLPAQDALRIFCDAIMVSPVKYKTEFANLKKNFVEDCESRIKATSVCAEEQQQLAKDRQQLEEKKQQRNSETESAGRLSKHEQKKKKNALRAAKKNDEKDDEKAV